MRKLFVASILVSTILSSSVLGCQTFTCPTGTYTVNYITNNYYGNYYEDCVVYDCDEYEYDYDYYDYDGCDDDANYLDYYVGSGEESADDYEECFNNYYSNESEYYEDYSCGYSNGCSGTMMCHWAYLRDDCGNIIGCLDSGTSVQIIGQCADNPGRTLIYDSCSGCYGTVASVYLYGGTDYEYENPTEWGGNYQYEETSSTAVVYGENDTWAADDMTWLEEECGGYQEDCGYEYTECSYTDYSECAYDYVYNYYTSSGCSYDYEDDDDQYYCTDASGSYWYDDEDCYEDDDCGMTWGECRTITNNYWVDVDISSNTVNFVNNGTVIFVGSYKDIKNLSELECGEYSCDDVKFKKKFCGQIEDYTCDDWCVRVHE